MHLSRTRRAFDALESGPSDERNQSMQGETLPWEPALTHASASAHRHRKKTGTQAPHDLTRSVKHRFNTRQSHSRIGYHTPIEHENLHYHLKNNITTSPTSSAKPGQPIPRTIRPKQWTIPEKQPIFVLVIT